MFLISRMTCKKNKNIYIAIAFVLWVALILLIEKTSIFFLIDRTSYELPYGLGVGRRSVVLPFLNFDGRNYLDIAVSGYFQKGEYNLRAFFPLYPLLVRLIYGFFKINPVYSGILVSFLSSLAFIFILYKLVEADYGDKKAFRVIAAFLVFPTSFFMLAFYTESVFLLLVILCFLSLRNKKRLVAAILAAMASATRITGLALFPVLAYDSYNHFKKNGKINLSFLISPLGFVAYSVYSFITTGDFLAMISGQNGWGKPLGLTGPFYAFKYAITNILSGPKLTYDSPFVYPVIVLEFFLTILIIIFLIRSRKKLKAEYWIYSLFSLLVILVGGFLSSAPRYFLVIFPIFIYAGVNLSKFKYIIYVSVSFLLFIFLSALFLRGYWVA